MELLNYIIDGALVLVPVLYIIGAFLKTTPRVPDWCIPWILLVIGVAGAIAILGVSAEAVIQGVLVAGATVLGNQLVKQTKDRN